MAIEESVKPSALTMVTVESVLENFEERRKRYLTNAENSNERYTQQQWLAVCRAVTKCSTYLNNHNFAHEDEDEAFQHALLYCDRDLAYEEALGIRGSTQKLRALQEIRDILANVTKQ